MHACTHDPIETHAYVSQMNSLYIQYTGQLPLKPWSTDHSFLVHIIISQQKVTLCICQSRVSPPHTHTQKHTQGLSLPCVLRARQWTGHSTKQSWSVADERKKD